MEARTQELLKTGKNEYLQRLSQEDRKNVMSITASFEEVMREKNKKGTLIAVGGSILKQLPRKDIDLVLVLAPTTQDLNRNDFASYHQYSIKDFQATFKDLVINIVKRNPSFRITEEIEPTLDEEFQTDYILKTDGSITVSTRKGTPVEFIRYGEKVTLEELFERVTKPFVILTTV